MKKPRLTRLDWIKIGLETLAHKGPGSLTVEELCHIAGKTRGSFYFHFKAIETFQLAVAESWFVQFTDKIITRPPAQTARLDLLNQLVARLDISLETGIRQLALRNEAVQTIVREADKQRIEWLGALYEKTSGYNAEEAMALAKIEYATFIGFKLVDPDLSLSEARDLYSAFLKFTDRA